MVSKRKYTVIDLFAGCGGLSLGLYQAGWSGIFAIEKNAFAFDTLKYNLIDNHKHFTWPDWLPQTPHDINEVLEKYESQLKSLRGTVDLVAGGPPCQGFSMAGKRVKDDVRNNLVFSYIEFIKLVQPKLVLFENVILALGGFLLAGALCLLGSAIFNSPLFNFPLYTIHIQVCSLLYLSSKVVA